MIKQNKFSKGSVAVTQIGILIIAIFAFAFLVGSMGLVSGGADEDVKSCEELGYSIKNSGDPYVYKCVGDGKYQGCNNGQEGGIYSVTDSMETTHLPIYSTCKKSDYSVEIDGKQTNVPEGYVDNNGNIVGGGLDWITKISGGVSGATTIYKLGEKGLEKIGILNKAVKVESIGDNLLTGDALPDLYKGTEGSYFQNASNSFWESYMGKEGAVAIKGFGEGLFGSIAISAIVATAASLITIWIYSSFAGDRNMQGWGWKAGAGIVAGTTIGTLASLGTVGILNSWNPVGWAALTAFLVTGTYLAATHQNFAQEQITFLPNSWTPEDGGKHCEECNKLEYGCSEYQCHTYGKSCGIINKGTDKEKCIDTNPGDTTPPTIMALEGSLPEGYKYNPIIIEAIDPPARGVEVVPKKIGETCIPPYTSLSLGIETNEPAECRIDTERKNKYDDMLATISNGYQQYEHRFTIPSSAMQSSEAIEKAIRGNDTSEEMENFINEFNLEEANDYEFYVMCKDTNGNVAPQSFVVEFCVDDGPDTEAPEILSTNYKEGKNYATFNRTTYPITVTTNEPATCRWSRTDLIYEDMENNITNPVTENLGQYTYKGEFTGVKDRETNNFYIRCQDKPWWTEGDSGKPYANKISTKIILQGTESLVISDVSINGKENGTTIKDSTNQVRVDFEVKTSAGADKGNSKCYYGTQFGEENVQFYNDGKDEYNYLNVNKKLYLEKGEYTYFIKCVDEGGNIAKTSIFFIVDIDNTAPIVVRAFKEYGSGGKDYLKIITDEEATCVYDTVNEEYYFEDGIPMTDMKEGLEHYTSWDAKKTFYIKCKDPYGKQPDFDGASIVVKPFEV